jgi:CHAT domain-containing protein
MRRSRIDEAIPWFEQALTPARLVEARPLIATALNNLVRCHNELGNFDQAIRYHQEAMRWLGSGEVIAVRRNLLEGMGRTYALERNALEATRYYRQALDMAPRGDVTDDVRRTLANNLAEALVNLGDWDAAARANGEETALARDDRAKAYARLNAAVIAAGRQRFEEAVADYEAALGAGAAGPPVRWEANAGLGRVYAHMGKDAPARQHFEKALRVIEENRAGLSRDQYKITFLARLIGFYQDYVESLMRSGDSDRALEVADSSRARILAEKILAEKISGEVPRTFRAADYREYAKRNNRVLLSYWLAPHESYGWVIAPAGSRCFRLPPADEVRGAVEAYQAFVEKALRDPLQTENAAARRLYETLVAPAAALIPSGAQVVLVPDGPLYGLNLETLPVYGGKPRYWIEDVTLSIAPSLSMLMTAAPNRPVERRSMLVFGDAIYADSPYQPLRYSAVELEKIGRHFPGAPREILTGARANPQAYLEAQPERFSMIHFSAHAEANRESPLDSAIVLSAKEARFKLYARDIMEKPLRSDLVTISACRGAGARAYAGEGLVGLAWAFLRSGARYTIAGLWDVDDSSTPGIMDALYGAMEAGQGPVQALRTAKLAMIRSVGAWRKPYYWGPFLIYGK